MTRMEILYLLRREEGEESALEAVRLIDSFSMEWVSCEPAILDKASEIKSNGRISVADSWIAATASVFTSTLIHKDPEFTPLVGISQELLK
jgi:predicted nucleic acid-binding protein